MTSEAVAKRHLRFGWWSLCVFATIGLALEILHGLKLGWYLEAAYETRRLMWTLGHAHGTLLALVHILYAMTLSSLEGSGRAHRWASPALIASSFLLPGGFLLGGVFIYDGDPGLGIVLVPVGAAAFVLATAVIAAACSKR